MKTFYWRHGGKVIGPLTSAQIRSLARDGKLRPEHNIAVSPDGAWVAAKEVKGLAFAEAVLQPVPAALNEEVSEEASEAVGQGPSQAIEQEITRVRPSAWRGHPVLMMMMSAGIGGAFWVVNSESGPMLATVLFILGTWAGGKVAWGILGSEMIITTERTRWRRGVFSKRVSEVRHRDVRQIGVEQTLVQRVLGTGRIRISSASQSGWEIDVEGIASPDMVAAQIRQRQG
jgi:uncharacterized membrane protein YdbT with pleckstrin-like domain